MYIYDLYDTLCAEATRFPELPIEIKKVGNYYPQGWEIEMIKSAISIHIYPSFLFSIATISSFVSSNKIIFVISLIA